jgi:aspartate aminotransferase-like enzyme/predicted cupin superfamily sugar epimerase
MSSSSTSVDPHGLLEYSVVFSDRSLNSMSDQFCKVMRDLSRLLKSMYRAEQLTIVPGGGTYGMEAIALQFAQDETCLIIRNGWFSYRWTQILERGHISSDVHVVSARQVLDQRQSPFRPPLIEEVVEHIHQQHPKAVFCPHVETSAGLMLPDHYLREVADAVHEVGGLFILDGVASGMCVVDMESIGVDILLTAPQKGFSSTPCAALIMMSERARAVAAQRESRSFANDLKKWMEIMERYVQGGHAYHATMPTDGLRQLRDTLLEAESIGFAELDRAQRMLGGEMRSLLSRAGFPSVAAPGFEAPSVIVSFTEDSEVKSGTYFKERGIQVAGGVPLMCGEREDFMTFRIGLFGLDKLLNIPRTVQRFKDALENLSPPHLGTVDVERREHVERPQEMVSVLRADAQRRLGTLINQLELIAHPEGGWYRETYRAPGTQPPRRDASTAIYFLLAQGQVSHFHRIDADELWHYYEGDPVRVHILDESGYREMLIGPLSITDAHPQGVVSAGAWFAAESVGGVAQYSLVGCTVAPAFDFDRFELAERDTLIALFPDHRSLVSRLTVDHSPNKGLIT